LHLLTILLTIWPLDAGAVRRKPACFLMGGDGIEPPTSCL
jgi:hypothetical protein